MKLAQLTMAVATVAVVIALSVGCGSGGSSGADGGAADATLPDATVAPDTLVGLPILGNGAHSADAVTVSVAGSATDGLNGPRALAFHPDQPGQLWVVNLADESVVIYGDATGKTPKALTLKRVTPSGHHFLARPSAIAFGMVGFGGKRNLATIHETDEKTQGPTGTPADFMGPTLYTADLAIFDGGHGGHLDMMHNSPNGMGIAWEKDNVFWVFDGAHAAITRYDFNKDHGPGGTYHGDGSVRRYVEGKVKRVADVPSHLAFDTKTGLLYIADTGNARIAVLDTKTGKKGGNLTPNYDGGEQVHMLGADIKTLVDGAKPQLKRPCGIALNGGTLYVTDNERSVIFAFDLKGNVLDWVKLDRPAGSLMGVAMGPDNKLYVVDNKANEVLRIEAKAK